MSDSEPLYKSIRDRIDIKMLSSLEWFLLCCDDRLRCRILDFCDAPSLMCVNQVNIQCHTIIRCYTAGSWNVELVLKAHFDFPKAILRTLRMTRALIFGISVLRFFDRGVDRRDPLDICLGYSGLESILAVLMAEGYFFVDSKNPEAAFYRKLIHATMSAPLHSLKSTGDKESEDSDCPSQRYTFQGFGNHTQPARIRTVVLHIVKCDNHQYVLRQASSTTFFCVFFCGLNLTSFPYPPASLMDIIDGSHAIMLFPRSTMSHRTSFTTRKASVEENVDIASQKVRLDRYSMSSRLAAVDGRPGSLRAELQEIGRRSYGDKECWVIPCCPLGSVYSTQELNMHLTNIVRTHGIFPF